MKRRVGAIVAALLAVIGFTFVVAEPAFATTYYDCQNGIACVWIGTNPPTGRMDIAVGNYGYNTCHNFSQTFNNDISAVSADFGGGWDIVLYDAANCDWGADSFIVPSSSFKSMTGFLAWFNDRASSFMICQCG